MTCQQQLRAEGKPYPRTCADCGLGPCYAPTILAAPHHCAPADIDALLRWLDAINDPQQKALPSLENTDWRGKAGVIARVIRFLREGTPGVETGAPDQLKEPK